MKTIHVAALQYDIERGQLAKNKAKAFELLRQAADAGADLVVLPEMWLSSFDYKELESNREGLRHESLEALHELGALCDELGVASIGSIFEIAEDGVFNTAYCFDLLGMPLGKYRKVHLFSPGGEGERFDAGDGPLAVDYEFARIGVSICYDLRFPEMYRELALAGVDIIVVPAQWPARRKEHYRLLLQARAVENQLFVIGCNRIGSDRVFGEFAGESCIISPWGEMLADASGKEGFCLAELDPAKMEEARSLIPTFKDRRPQAYQVKRSG